MEIINKILYISYGELIRSDDNPTGIMTESMYKKLCYTKGVLKKLNRGCYGCPILIEFDSLPLKYRTAWIDMHGDPRITHEVQGLASRIKPDMEARRIYTEYRFENNPSQGIKAERIEQYCTDAMILNAIRTEIVDFTQVRARSGARPSGYWEAALQRLNSIRKLFPYCSLPKTATTLKRKYELYVKDGYESLIHKGNGNQNTSAVTDELSKAFLIELLAHGTQFSCETVADKYNVWAAANDKREITARTVVNFAQKNDAEICMYRLGKRKWEDKYGKVMHRDRPSAPLLLVNSDDNDLDLYFKVELERKVKGKLTLVKTDYYRFKLYVVIDAHCDYILGYAYGHEITKEVVRAAYRNAANHVKELTGKYYMWHQIVADRWGLKSAELKQFYERQAIFTPPAHDNARSKVIEASFGIIWHRGLKEYDNYCGHNVTAGTKLAQEWVEQHKANFPNYKEGVRQIEQFVEKMRDVEWKNSGKSRRQVWAENFTESEAAKERQISREVYLSLFGEQHEYTNRLTNRGVDITIDNEKFIYDIPDSIYIDVVGRKAQVTYDPCDMDSILVTDDNGMRFVAQKYVKNKMALYDQSTSDQKIIDQRIAAKKEHRNTIIKNKEIREEITSLSGIDAEGWLKSGFLTKEDSFAAQAAYRSATHGGENLDEDEVNFLSTFLSKKSKNKTKEITQ